MLFIERETGRLVEANAAAVAAYGYARAELLSLTIRELRAPETSSLTEQQMAAAEAGGILFETVHQRRDGSTFPVEVSSRGAVVDGVRMLVSVVRDITDRKRAQTRERRAAQALRASEARLKRLAEALPQLVWTADAQGRLDWFNQRWRDYTGHVAGEEGWDPALHPDDRERVGALWREALAGGRAFEIEHRLRGAGGGFRWFLRRAFPLRDPDGAIDHWFGTCTDIHDLKVSHEVLSQADRLKEEFLSMASHEFRTPLAALRLQTDLLRERLRRAHGEEERTERQLAIIDKQIRRLVKLIDVLLDVSRIIDGKLRLDLGEVDLADVVRDVAERLALEAAQAGTEIRLIMTSATGRWDRTRLDQVVTNLLSNAIKYGEKQPVEVSVEPRGDQAVLVVRDRGIGIPRESHARVFERFQRADNTGAVSGLGLGLWIARSMVAAHGGEIRVDSAPGEGAAFTVSLPTSPPAR